MSWRFLKELMKHGFQCCGIHAKHRSWIKEWVPERDDIFKMPFLRIPNPYRLLSSGTTIGFWQGCFVTMLRATINSLKCATKSCLKGFPVTQPIILRKLLHGDSICFFIVLYSSPLVDVCRLLHIWIQLEIPLYVDIIICLYMCSAEAQLLIRVGVGLYVRRFPFPFIRHPQ